MNKKHEHIPFTELEERVAQRIINSREKVAIRFPLLFGLATSFGLVSTFYGFEGLINKVDWLSNNPWAMLGVGIAVLIATGTAYKKLN